MIEFGNGVKLFGVNRYGRSDEWYREAHAWPLPEGISISTIESIGA